MKIEAEQIGVLYLSSPINLGGSRMSVPANDAQFQIIPGVGVHVESRGPDRQTMLIPWRSIDRMEMGGSALTLPPSPRVAAPPPAPPAPPPPAPRRDPPPLTPHELAARAALEERKRLAEERTRARAAEQPARSSRGEA
jgi:hypothetical protein